MDNIDLFLHYWLHDETILLIKSIYKTKKYQCHGHPGRDSISYQQGLFSRSAGGHEPKGCLRQVSAHTVGNFWQACGSPDGGVLARCAAVTVLSQCRARFNCIKDMPTAAMIGCGLKIGCARRVLKQPHTRRRKAVARLRQGHTLMRGRQRHANNIVQILLQKMRQIASTAQEKMAEAAAISFFYYMESQGYCRVRTHAAC